MFGFAPVLCFAQANGSNQAALDAALRVKPQASVVVRAHATGADLVEVTVLDPKYPADLLKSQVEKLGEELKVPPRGLFVFRGKDSMQFLKANFAVNGLGRNGEPYLQPIVRAFASAPNPFTVNALLVSFAGFKPASTALRTFVSSSVVVSGQYVPDPQGIEYRIALVSQEPGDIVIPEKAAANPTTQPKNVPEAQPSASKLPLIIGLVIAGSVLVGCLVYFALLGSGLRSGRKK